MKFGARKLSCAAPHVANAVTDKILKTKYPLNHCAIKVHRPDTVGFPAFDGSILLTQTFNN